MRMRVDATKFCEWTKYALRTYSLRSRLRVRACFLVFFKRQRTHAYRLMQRQMPRTMSQFHIYILEVRPITSLLKVEIRHAEKIYFIRMA